MARFGIILDRHGDLAFLNTASEHITNQNKPAARHSSGSVRYCGKSTATIRNYGAHAYMRLT